MSIVVDHLSFAYPRVNVLREVTASAAPGKITAVLGPNAAGKTTLLRCIIGALHPGAGQALIDGKPSHRMKTARLAQRLAYVPQRSVISAAFTVRQVVELGRYALPVNRTKVADAIARLDLADLADRPYPALSVGQQQRVALARAVAQLSDDGHLILDEPASAMDLLHVRQAALLLRELAQRGVTILIAMHDLALAASLVDEVWLLAEGCLITAGAACDALDPTRLQSVFDVGFEWVRSSSGHPVLVSGVLPAAGPSTMPPHG